MSQLSFFQNIVITTHSTSIRRRNHSLCQVPRSRYAFEKWNTLTLQKKTKSKCRNNENELIYYFQSTFISSSEQLLSLPDPPNMWNIYETVRHCYHFNWISGASNCRLLPKTAEGLFQTWLLIFERQWQWQQCCFFNHHFLWHVSW